MPDQTVQERLLQFIEYKGLSKNKFEQMCGLSSRYVSNISVSIQPDKVKKISLVYPELNTGWLLTGEGSMIKAPGAVTQVIGTNTGTAINGGGQDAKRPDQPEDFKVVLTKEQFDELLKQNSQLLRIIENLTSK